MAEAVAVRVAQPLPPQLVVVVEVVPPLPPPLPPRTMLPPPPRPPLLVTVEPPLPPLPPPKTTPPLLPPPLGQVLQLLLPRAVLVVLPPLPPAGTEVPLLLSLPPITPPPPLPHPPTTASPQAVAEVPPPLLLQQPGASSSLPAGRESASPGANPPTSLSSHEFASTSSISARVSDIFSMVLLSFNACEGWVVQHIICPRQGCSASAVLYLNVVFIVCIFEDILPLSTVAQ